MGVYVKEMNMPRNCRECPFCIEHIDDLSCIMLTGDGDCPLVEVKTPHGRLVDIGKITSGGYDPMKGVTLIAETVIEAED